MTRLLAAALAYAERGRRVFACSPSGKQPLYSNPHGPGSTCRGECGRWGHGCLDATVDTDIITTWWTRTPSANIGVACGTPGGPDVVDVDVKDGQPGIATLARLRDAGFTAGAEATIRTPSGGLHIWYTGTGQGNGRLPRHGIDFRSAGGYVVAPPSVVDGKPYELIADRPATGVTIDFAAIRRFLIPPPPPRFDGTSRPATFEGLIRHVADQHERSHNRNDALHWAASRAMDQGASEDVYRALVQAATANGLPHNEALRTVMSARRRAGAVQ